MRKLLLFFFKILELINKILPKNKLRIVLYSNLGFRDNIEAFFSFLIKNDYYNNYHIVVATNDYTKLQRMEKIKYTGRIRGIFFFLTSKYFFYSFGKYPIMPAKDQIVVNLWHGMPLKKIGNLEKGKESIKYDYFSLVLSTSKFFDTIMMKSFNCEETRIMHVGQPRTDYFYSKTTNRIFQDFTKTIIWMPTFRTTDILHESNTSNKDAILPLINSNIDLEKLNDLFIKYNSILVIKLHPIQSIKALSFTKLSNIIFIDENYLKRKGINLYQFLPETDCLITDYSSVFFDYLLLDKPIIFTTNDLEDYKSNRGLNFENLEEIMPGEKVKTLDELLIKLSTFFSGQDEKKQLRNKVNLVLNEYSSVNNCRKICDLCGIQKEKNL